MPRKSKLKKNAANKALRMNAAKRTRKITSANENKNNEDSIQIETPSGLLQSPSSFKVSEIQSNVPTPAQEPIEHLTIERSALQKSSTASIDGRRIIDIVYFYSRLQEVSKHGSMDCGLGCVEIVGERQIGLFSKFTLKCQMCGEVFYVENDLPGEININNCAVAGTIAIGCGHSQLEELSAALNLPLMTPKTYKACHCQLSTHWEKMSVESMNAAAQKERELAIAEGRVDENGIPIIDVIVDGCWCKRTYKKNYSALSGAAAIIGKMTGEVLFLGVKNKYCSICAQAQKVNKVAKEHNCYKNYNGPSTAMEAKILVEGFKCSIEMHNLIYGRMVSDGDSSTYSQLLKSRPYANITVEKIECRNHLLRNLCNKLTALQTDTKFTLKYRKVVTQSKIMILRKTIRKIIQAYKADSESKRRCNIELLYNDLLLAHLHAFDNHNRCKRIFCNVGNDESQSIESDFYTSTLWSRICLLMSNLASHAPSLIHDVDSNSVERYNSIVAKLVGGKRINFSKRGSYQTRCHAAVVSFNTHRVISSVYKSMAGRSPRGSFKKLENKRLKRATMLRKIVRKKNRLLFSKAEDINYGDKCEKPDMPPDMYEKKKITFLQNLAKTKEEREQIERDTILQSLCSEWLELRRNILTASNFGKVIKRRNDISCQNLVKDIIYKDSIAHVRSIKHGKDNEQKALRQLEIQENIKINPCGLFIDEEYHYLGATPDGVIDSGTIVEIKCPISAFQKNDIKEIVRNKKLPFYKLNHQDQLIINKNHNWFYQVQGQLHISKKLKCLFAIWTGESNEIITEVIIKDDHMWEHEMKPKLNKFYLECLLPELIDPRLPRNMKIRDPEYIQKAIDEKEINRKRKWTDTHEERNEEQNAENIDTQNMGQYKKQIMTYTENHHVEQFGEVRENLQVLVEQNFSEENVSGNDNNYARELKFNEF